MFSAQDANIAIVGRRRGIVQENENPNRLQIQQLVTPINRKPRATMKKSERRMQPATTVFDGNHLRARRHIVLETIRLEMGRRSFGCRHTLYQIFTIRIQCLFGTSELVTLAGLGTDGYTSNRSGAPETSLVSTRSPIFPELKWSRWWSICGFGFLRTREDEEDGEELLTRDPNKGTRRRARDCWVARRRAIVSSRQLTNDFLRLFSLLLELARAVSSSSSAPERLTTGGVGRVLARRAPACAVRRWVACGVLPASESREAGVVAAISREDARDLTVGRGTRAMGESNRACARAVFIWVAGGGLSLSESLLVMESEPRSTAVHDTESSFKLGFIIRADDDDGRSCYI